MDACFNCIETGVGANHCSLCTSLAPLSAVQSCVNCIAAPSIRVS
jgi:hypothetical protein